MSDEMDVLDKLAPRKVEIKTDHGGFGLGDLIVVVLGVVLLLYTGYRTWHVLSTTVVTDAEVIAVLGLWGLDIGAVAWGAVWIFGSTTWMQNVVSIVMWVVDLIGMIGTSLLDTLTPVGKMPANMSTIIFYGVTFIIAGNVVVGFIYHMTSPHTRRVRKERAMNEEIAEKREKKEFQLKKDEMEEQLDLDERRMKLEQRERRIAQRQVLIERMRQAAKQKVELDGIELGLAKLLDDKEYAEKIAADIKSGLGNKLAASGKSPTFQDELKQLAHESEVDINKDETTESEPPTAPPEPSKLDQLREAIGRVVPHGQGGNGTGNGSTDPNA